MNVNQTGSKNSSNYQYNDMSENTLVVNNNGVTYSDVKQIALDVFKNEIDKLSTEAAKTVDNRINDLINEFFINIGDNYDELYKKLSMPSVQNSIYNAEKGYALDETSNSKEYYLFYMEKRLNAPERSLIQIATDEAINVMSRLTNEQIDCLSFIFTMNYDNENLLSKKDLLVYINRLCDLYHDDFLLPYMPLTLRASNVCASLDATKYYIAINELLYRNYPGLFYKGQTEEEILSDLEINDFSLIHDIFMPCIWDDTKYQINSANLNTLNSIIDSNSNYKEYGNKLINMFKRNIMNQNDIKNKLLEIDSRIDKIIEIQNKSNLKYCVLTPSGIIIAICNLKIKYGLDFDIEKYIKMAQ